MLALIGMLTLLASGGFLVSTGRGLLGLIALGSAGLLALVFARGSRAGSDARPTRYRDVRLHRGDRLVIAISLLSGIALLFISSLHDAALRYEPYPAIAWPQPYLPIIVVIGLLMLPAFLLPGGGAKR